MNARTRILAFIVGALLGPLAVAAGPSSDASNPVKQSGAAVPHSASGGSLRKVFLGQRIDDYHFARYVVDWAAKVERVGTLNFPRGAEGKLYGNLLVIVEIDADGELLDVAIRRSSGSTELDDATIRIVRLAAPYAAFTSEMRRKADVVVIARAFRFDRGEPTGDQAPPEPSATSTLSLPSGGGSCEMPKYPPGSMASNEQGTVTLLFLISKSGDVLESRIERSSGHERLDVAALSALSACRFRPIEKGGESQQGWGRLQFEWVLAD